MAHDCRDLELTTASADAARAFDHVIAGYLGLALDTGERLKDLFAADAEMPMAHVLKGYFFMLMGLAPLRAKAGEIAVEVQPMMAGATPREQLHGQALAHWTAGHNGAALAAWEEILSDHPRDILALRLAHHGYFYKGDSQNVRDVVARTLDAWDATQPGYGFVMGMRAFGLEETHAYEPAIAAGRLAVEANPNDPWAIHAVAHVYEMMDTPDVGVAWITENEPGWTGANNFRNHLYWHRALMWLDRGDYDAALGAFDQTWDPASEEYLDFCNDASLLMRLELHDVDVGQRWQGLAEKCRARTGEHLHTFFDGHFALALASVGAPEADRLLASLNTYAAGSDADNAKVSAEIGVPLAEALMAYRSGDFDRCVERLHPIRYRLHAIGGSHAQRDLFAMVLIDAALRAGRWPMARALTAERLARMPGNVWTDKAYQRALAGMAQSAP